METVADVVDATPTTWNSVPIAISGRPPPDVETVAVEQVIMRPAKHKRTAKTKANVRRRL